MAYSHKVGLTYEYFVLEQIKKDYDKVWHWKNFPEKLMYENNLIKDYNPDYFIIGDDYLDKPIIGSEYAKKVVYFNKINGYSTTNLIYKCKSDVTRTTNY